jgi:hypothetical protein
MKLSLDQRSTYGLSHLVDGPSNVFLASYWKCNYQFLGHHYYSKFQYTRYSISINITSNFFHRDLVSLS